MRCILVILAVFIFENGWAQSSDMERFAKLEDLGADPTQIVVKNDSIPLLIPRKKNGLYGFVNQNGKFVIQPQYSNVGFFAEDCNLTSSANLHARKYGSNQYASVRKNDVDYRIDAKGRNAYKFVDADLASCPPQFKKQKFNAYSQNGFYGIINNQTFKNPLDHKQYSIYPQYQYLYILEGDDLNNPMIIAVHNDMFGIVDVNNNIIVPFVYEDIKRNFSWKLARLFEVTQNGVDYFYVDQHNHRY